MSKRKPKTDYQERAYTLYKAQLGSPDLLRIQRDLEQVSEGMLRNFLTLPMFEMEQYLIICNRIDYGDGGYWERNDEVAMRMWRKKGARDEYLQMGSASINMLIANILRAKWESDK